MLVASTSVAIDLFLRGDRIRRLDSSAHAFYVLSALLGIVFWSAVLTVAIRIRGAARWAVRLVVVVWALLAIGTQLLAFARFGAYVNDDAMYSGTSLLPDIRQALSTDPWTSAGIFVPCLVVAAFVPALGARVAPLSVRPREWMAFDVALVAGLTLVLVSPHHGAPQGQPPDTMYLSSAAQLLRARWEHNETVERVHPAARTPPPIPKLTPAPGRPRNVVLVITESVRATSVCMDYSADCELTPFSNSAAKERIALTQMRALDSTTAISLSVMLSGLPPMSKRSALLGAPMLWEYAHAAGIEAAYYTSQHLLFGNLGAWLRTPAWTRHANATTLDQAAPYDVGADDGQLVDSVLGDLGALREPYFAVVHFSNTHYPYKTDRVEEGLLLPRYEHAIMRQDRALAHLVRGVRQRPEGERTVVVYVSDHGEQIGENGAVGHTYSLIDPEIHVPFWVDAPAGTLTSGEREHLRALHTTPLTQLDVFPTVMDLLGLWGKPELASFREPVPGESLLRGGTVPGRPVLFSNCTELWGCWIKNWGAMAGTRKLFSTVNDEDWRCLDVAEDPAEKHPLDLESCADLVSFTEASLGRPF